MLRVVPAQTPLSPSTGDFRGDRGRGMEPSCPGRGAGVALTLSGGISVCSSLRHKHLCSWGQSERLQLSPRGFTLTNSVVPKVVIAFSELSVLVLQSWAVPALLRAHTLICCRDTLNANKGRDIYSGKWECLKNLIFQFHPPQQSKDDELSIQLLSSDLLEEFKGSLGCQAVSELMGFYMEEVLPSAISASAQHQRSVGDLGNLLLSLRGMMRRCHRFFTCEERSKSMKNIKETFSKMHRNGIYKAMGEFDIFINYIEKYLTMKRRH
ncbi:interleukin-10 isoform X1 [Catharus ustulatus]|uniref:interleukin-10 isoform X1 n=1 Tax=Catharus ustulatus TaxID=91951 RepID=UPI00140A95D3|nr:interleukin-10 isoform X1 [Catharus ustulatus]